ncbi:MAG TPA: 2-amino-4-hydroxy-6-hydroxymethyldihydropteridine diphosphokinase [Rhodanobacteraceae bacterium]|nr:2-amino-4-hydroxy-6-hydroxymethyldihydropteridine diphosphokinase [Rhodanobacteraceae bacterium]
MARVYLSLGSNLDPGRHLRDALTALRARFGEVAVSTVYRSDVVGFAGAPFLNCAAAFEADLEHDMLREWLRELEDAGGRDRSLPRYADRTLDLDIALWCDHDTCRTDLSREEFERAHVLAPLADIAPDVRDPFAGEALGVRWERLAPGLPPLQRLPSGALG